MIAIQTFMMKRGVESLVFSNERCYWTNGQKNSRKPRNQWFRISVPISEFPHISWSTVYRIVTSKLDYRKLCARWAPKMLTDAHKNQRMASACPCLECYKWEGKGREMNFSHIINWWWNMDFIHQFLWPNNDNAVASFKFTENKKIKTKTVVNCSHSWHLAKHAAWLTAKKIHQLKQKLSYRPLKTMVLHSLISICLLYTSYVFWLSGGTFCSSSGAGPFNERTSETPLSFSVQLFAHAAASN